ncbi:MAG: peptidylprolyl isomerase [Elusimicrobia bacterium]|nr:peptidylprolyl isomerase [Elusimicrobiota bacterium]
MKKALSALFALVVLAGCSKKPVETPAVTPEPAPAVSAPAAPAPVSDALLFPQKAMERAPAVYKARFSTTKGDFVVEVHRDWAPNGADRFYNLVKVGFFDGEVFFRAVEGFMVQFGLNGSPDVNGVWRQAAIADDPAAGQSNKRGFITFATAGPNTRTTQVFINYADNGRLDSMGFTPFGQVVEGMDVVDALYKGYGDAPPNGRGPDQGRIQMEGNSYLKRDFPLLDSVKTAQLLP